MRPVRRPSAFAAALALAAAVAGASAGLLAPPAPAVAAPRAKKAPTLPGWSLVGDFDLAVPVGFADLTGRYYFGTVNGYPHTATTIDGRSGNFQIAYQPDATLTVTTFLDDFTFVSFLGTWSVDGAGEQHVDIRDRAKNPSFVFSGTVQPNGRDIEGTYFRKAGFLGAVADEEGVALSLRRDPQQANVVSAFRLQANVTMDRKGRVTGAVGMDGKPERVTLDVHGGRQFTGGKVTGLVRTSAVDGTTTAKLAIRGKGWRLLVDGPVDGEEGGPGTFHGAADIQAGGFDLDDVPLDLACGAGPEPPPPPPPPPPKNQIAGAVAQVAAGRVTITRDRAPKKLFGKTSDVHVEFPLSILSASDQTLVANASTGSGASAVRFYVEIGTTVLGAAGPGGEVTIQVVEYAPPVIRVLCKGTVASAAGVTKPLRVPNSGLEGILFEATIVP